MSKMLKAMTAWPIRILSTLPDQLGRSIFQKQLLPAFFPPARQQQLENQVSGYFQRYLKKSESDSRLLAKDYLEHYLSKITDDVMLLNWPIRRLRARLEKRIQVSGIENLRQVLGANRGVILLGSHIGSVFLGTLGLLKICLEEPGFENRGLSVCSEPEMASYPLIQNWAREAEKIYRASLEVISVNKGTGNPAILMIRALEKKRLLTTNLDVLAGGTDRQIYSLLNNMGVYLPALKGALECAFRSGAIVLPWFNLRDGCGKLKVIFEKPLDHFTREGVKIDKKALLQECQQHLSFLFQSYLETYPSQWLYWDRLERRLVK